MRIERLDLIRYGRFTDHVIPFGARPAGRPDLHVVYGPNEAGKSTALDALVSLLYGIPRQTPYAFRHPRSSMAVGARLEIGGKVVDYTRFPNTPTLRDAGGDVVPEGVFAAALSGLDRAAYKAMFSLDEDTLVAGGEDILKSKGELGGMLFSASAGLAGFTETIAKLEDEADLLYKPSGRSHRLKALETELAALKAREVELEVPTKTYRAARGKADRAEAELATAKTERARLDRQAATLMRLLVALPRRDRIDRLTRERAAIAHLPPPPQGWATRVDDMTLAFARLEAERLAKQTALERIEAERMSVVPDPALQAAAAAIDRVAAFRPRQVTAEEDIPRRTLQRDEALTRLTEAVRDLGRPDAAAPEAARGLILTRASVSELSDLASRRDGLLERAFAAEDAVGAARERLAKARGALEALAPAVTGDGLPALVSRLRRSRTPVEIDQIRTQVARLEAKIADELAALAPLLPADAVDIDPRLTALQALVLPDRATVVRWQETETALDAEATTARQRHGDLDERLALAEARRAALATRADVVDDAAFERLTTAVEAAWAAHRASFTAATADALDHTADAYEAARTARDLAQAGRAKAADLIADRRALADEIASLEAAMSAVMRRRAEIERERDSLREAIAGAAAARIERAGELLALMDRRAAVLADLPARRDFARAIERLEASLLEDRQELIESLTRQGLSVDPRASFADLLDEADRHAERAAKDAGARETAERALVEATQDVERRQRQAEAARAEVTAWDAAWAEALSATWLKGDPAGRSPATVRAVLDGFGDVREALQSIDQYTAQVDSMRRDQATYGALVSEAARLAGRLPTTGAPLGPADLVALGDQLLTALDRQRGQQLRLDQLDAERTAAMAALEAVELQLTQLAAERDAMLAHYGVTDLAALKAALEAAATAARLSDEIAGEAEALMGGLGVVTLEEARAALEGVDELALAEEQAALDRARAEINERVQAAATALAEARAELDAIPDGDLAARLQEDRKTILLEIAATAERYARLRLGIQATQAALRAYRDRHRSAMLTDAADRFRRITQGGFTDLRTQAIAQGEMLIAIQAGGASLTADDLSKGTRDQLYLALRMAGYVEWTRTREPLPFVADDIMETFDDGRAGATFAMLADVARHGQVIYLTHHAHLVALAREVCGADVTIHELSPTQA